MKILILMLMFVACDDDSNDNCPTNFSLPEYSTSGENLMACEIDGDVWIGDQTETCVGIFGCSYSFEIYVFPKKDEDGNYLRDEEGKLIKDSIANIRYRSTFIYDCENFKETDFSFEFYVSLNTKELVRWNNKPPKIFFHDYSNSKSYGFLIDEPYTFFVTVDTINNQASGTFSGIFEEYDTGEQLEITNGFFDMTEK